MVTNVGNVFKRPSAEERKRLRKGRQKSISDGVQFMRDFNAADTARSFHDSPPRLSDAAAEKLVSVDEDQMFQQPPLTANVDGQDNVNLSSNRLSTVEERRKERRRLRKSQSENVAAMRAMTIDDFSALDTSTSRQRRSIANMGANSALRLSAPQQGNMEKPTPKTGGELFDHLARIELSPIKSEEEDTKITTNVDDDVNYIAFQKILKTPNTPPKKNGNDNDDVLIETPSKIISPAPTILSTSKDDFSIPSSRRISREDTDAATLNGHSKASEILERKQARRRRQNLRTQSEGVAFMRSSLADTDTDSVKTTSLAPVCELGGDSQLETLAGLAKLSAKDLPEIPPFEEKRRRTRLRSASDGVAAMTMGLVRDSDSPKSPALTGNSASSESNEKDLPIESTSDDIIEEEHPKPSNRVSFAIFHTSSASKALSSPTDRLSSIDSAASDDGDSDIDDVPDALQEDISVTPSKHIFSKPRIDLTSFLQSGKYPAASFLYGPMICLFVIG